MRALASVSLLFALLAAPAAAEHRLPAPSSPPKPWLGAKLTACTTGAEPRSRAATFTGSMPAIRGTRRMAMRFELHQRIPGGSFAAVAVPGWQGWERSERRRSGFIYTKRVQDLMAPAGYRAILRLRWYGRGGKLLRELRRTTQECVQPDPRPDLVVGRLGARATADPATLAYEIVIENVGGSAADAFDLVLAVGGRAQPAATAGPLATGSRELVSVVAPRCEPGSSVSVSLDPDGRIAEGDESNTFTRPCPVAG